MRRRHVLVLVAALPLTAAAFAAEPAPGAPATPQRPSSATPAAPTKIVFHELDAAVDRSVATERVLAIYFTADWCGWCRKMEASTFTDAGVVAAAERMSWSKVDIDERPDVAAIFGIQGVPALVFLNTRGEFLGGQSGYLAPSPMKELIEGHADKASAPGALREGAESLLKAHSALADAATDEEFAAAVASTVELLAKPASSGPPRKRERLTQSLVATGPRAWRPLVELLRSERLAVRAAAWEALRASAPNGNNPSFDPFAEPEPREQQAAAWTAWLEAQPEPAKPG